MSFEIQNMTSPVLMGWRKRKCVGTHGIRTSAILSLLLLYSPCYGSRHVVRKDHDVLFLLSLVKKGQLEIACALIASYFIP